MRIFLFSFLAFLVGTVAGWCAVVGVYIVQTTLFGMFDRDGGGAMGAIFILGPLVGMVVGLVLAIVTAVRMRARRAA